MLELRWWSSSPGAPLHTTFYDETDEVIAYRQETGLSCAGAPYSFPTYQLRASTCVCGTPEGCFSPCGRATTVSVDFAPTAAQLGCPTPPPPTCGDPSGTSGASAASCQSCVPAGGGCDVGIGGKDLSCTPPDGGPGAFLHYRLLGPGHSGFPGSTAAWAGEMGLYWSHDYLQRLVPVGTSVWFISGSGSFVEFKALGGTTGARQYTQVSPSDEHRRLFLDDHLQLPDGDGVGPWRLVSLDGRTDHFFASSGKWNKATFANDATALQATYHSTTGKLTQVTLRDGRRERFHYYGGADPGENGTDKLWKIIEDGVGWDTGPVLSRTWEYVWSGSGDRLTNIGRPDGTSWEFTYNSPHIGQEAFLTQVRLVGTDLSGRIEAGFDYDAFGNVAHSWRGATTFGDLNAIEKRTFTYVNPNLPTQTTVVDGLDNQTVYSLARDTASIKPKVLSRQGTCAPNGCGGPPSATYEYTHAAHPLLPSAMLDNRTPEVRTEYTYTAEGRPFELVEAKGTPLERKTTWRYSAAFPGIVREVERPSTDSTPGRLRLTTFTVDGATGNVSPQVLSGYEAGVFFNHPTAYTYNAAGEVLTTDPPGTGDTVTYTYNLAGRNGHVADSRTDPIVGVTTFEYNEFNQRTRVVDPNGVGAQTVYDQGPLAGGSVTLRRPRELRQQGASSPADDLVTQHTYNTLGDLFCVVSAAPNGPGLAKGAVQYGYDFAGRLEEVQRGWAVASPTGSSCIDATQPRERTFFTLDNEGNRIAEELQRASGGGGFGPADSRTTYIYTCHLDKVTQGDGSATPSVTEYCYDQQDNLEQVWDPLRDRASFPNSPTTLSTYDALNRLSTVTTGPGTALAAATTYSYDKQDHLASVTDAEGNVTTYTTSDRDLLTQEVSPVSGTTIYTYSARGELLTRTDARGVTVTRTLDALGRVTLEDYPGTAQDTTYDYDGDGATLQPFRLGRLRSMSRPGQPPLLYDYDRFGRVTADGGLTFLYDANGNPQSITYPGGSAATYGYDFADRQRTLQVTHCGTPTTLVANASYYPAGPLATLELGNDLVEQRTFDERYFPDSIVVPGRLQWDYTTDGLGNPVGIADLANPSNNRSFEYQPFQYFLTAASGPWPGPPLGWTYDRIGNRLTETRNGSTDIYAYVTNAGGGNTPLLDQVLPQSGGARNYDFDPAGNLKLLTTAASSTALGVDEAGRHSSVEPAGAPNGLAMSYDGRGFLWRATTAALPFSDGFEVGSPCAWSAVTPGTLPPGCPPPRPFVQATYSSDGTVRALTRNVAPQSTLFFYFAGRPVAQLDVSGGNPSWKFLTTDHLGTPVIATAPGPGAGLLWFGGFEPFGEDFSGAGAAGLPLRLPGQWESPLFTLGGVGGELYYNVHRWYQPATGRYSQRDPILGSQRPFAYASNNPLSGSDPLGLYVIRLNEQPPEVTFGAAGTQPESVDALGRCYCCGDSWCASFDIDARYHFRFPPGVRDCTRDHEQLHVAVFVSWIRRSADRTLLPAEQRRYSSRGECQGALGRARGEFLDRLQSEHWLLTLAQFNYHVQIQLPEFFYLCPPFGK